MGNFPKILTLWNVKLARNSKEFKIYIVVPTLMDRLASKFFLSKIKCIILDLEDIQVKIVEEFPMSLFF